MSTSPQDKPAEETEPTKDEMFTILKTEYDALVQERDQLKINLYVLLTNLKDQGYQVADQGMSLQRVSTDALARLKLTPEQMNMLKQQIQQ